jgi:predicted RNA polymerase sigma factor
METEGDTSAVEAEFAGFARFEGERARRALIAYFGVEVGSEAWHHAMVEARQRWDEVSTMTNPVGYVVRLGRMYGRAGARWTHRRSIFPSTDRLQSAYDGAMVDLFGALAEVRPEQRAALMLVKAYGCSPQEAAAALEIPEDAVAHHIRRGLSRLRWFLEVE